MRSRQILVVEDEKDICVTLEILIERLGHEPHCVSDSAEALDKLIQTHIEVSPMDLLLYDIQIPGMTGANLIETMRRINIATPALVITGFNDKALVERLVHLGCSDFIEKPFTPDDVEQSVKRLVNEIDSIEEKKRRMEFRNASAR